MSDPLGIFNWRRLDAWTTTSGHPREDELAAIRDLGVTHVVNLALHTHEKALADEAASVAALGMTYTHIPVEFDAPTEADYRRFVAAMAAAAGGTVHVHCIVNARVSAFFYRLQIEQGRSPDEARATMESIWRPGGVWARFIGDAAGSDLPHRFAGREY